MVGFVESVLFRHHKHSHMSNICPFKIKACVWCRGAASWIHHHKTEKLFMAVKLVMNVCVPLQIC